jgi:hypothetical protein
MLLLSRDSEYLLEVVLVKFVVRGSQKALNRLLRNTGSPARKPERHIDEKSKAGVASDMRTAFLQQHSERNEKNICLQAWQAMTSFNSPIPDFVHNRYSVMLQRRPR